MDIRLFAASVRAQSFVNATAALFALFAAGTPASAQTIPATDILPPGGLTFGGPGNFESATSPSSRFVYFGNVPRNMCLTLTNQGSTTLSSSWRVSSTVVLNSGIFAAAGESNTVCIDGATSIQVNCLSSPGGLCKYIWRLDDQP